MRAPSSPRRWSAAAAEGWKRLRAWRRIRFTRAGVLFTLGALGVGFAAINTGNNLLYLLLGAMLGAMAVSGWLSEQTLRGLHITRTVPAGVPVERDFRIRYRVTNGKRWIPSLAVELREPGLPGLAFLSHLGPGETRGTNSAERFVRRGVYPLEVLTLATDFPFGLFRKERDVPLPGELVVWPRTDRPVPDGALGAGQDPAPASASAHASAGPRGEFRSLREYRSGDDARDIHWRTSARLRQPVVREYEREAGRAVWVVLDTSHPPGDAAEAAVETAASLCARAARGARTFGLSAGPHLVEPGAGEAHLERALDALARVDFGGAGPHPLPGPPEQTVLVTLGAAHPPGVASVIRPHAPPTPVPGTAGAA